MRNVYMQLQPQAKRMLPGNHALVSRKSSQSIDHPYKELKTSDWCPRAEQIDVDVAASAELW